MEVGKHSGIQCRPGIFGGIRTPRRYRVNAGLDGDALHPYDRGFVIAVDTEDRRRIARPAKHPDQVGRPYGRRVVNVVPTVLTYPAQDVFRLLTPTEQNKVHGPRPDGLPSTGIGCGS